MKTKKERNQETINNLLTSLRGKEAKKADGPIDLWAGKKPNSKMQHLTHPHQLKYKVLGNAIINIE
jgi:hypothetical protein